MFSGRSNYLLMRSSHDPATYRWASAGNGVVRSFSEGTGPCPVDAWSIEKGGKVAGTEEWASGTSHAPGGAFSPGGVPMDISDANWSGDICNPGSGDRVSA